MATIRAEFSSPTVEVAIEVTSSNIPDMVRLEERIREFLMPLLDGSDSTDEKPEGKSIRQRVIENTTSANADVGVLQPSDRA